MLRNLDSLGCFACLDWFLVLVVLVVVNVVMVLFLVCFVLFAIGGGLIVGMMLYGLFSAVICCWFVKSMFCLRFVVVFDLIGRLCRVVLLRLR